MRKPNFIKDKEMATLDFRDFILKGTPDLPNYIIEAEANSYSVGFSEAVNKYCVPDMIDALIEAYLLIDDMPIDMRNERELRVYNSIADSLEKAGVEL